MDFCLFPIILKGSQQAEDADTEPHHRLITSEHSALIGTRVWGHDARARSSFRSRRFRLFPATGPITSYLKKDTRAHR
jgi:hypothetical protein